MLMRRLLPGAAAPGCGTTRAATTGGTPDGPLGDREVDDPARSLGEVDQGVAGGSEHGVADAFGWRCCVQPSSAPGAAILKMQGSNLEARRNINRWTGGIGRLCSDS
jgi:hypothetical protein